METRAHHVLIGLFTVIVVAGALLFGLWLAKSNVDSEFKYYEVVFNEAVSGLSRGSSVEYSGIKVGDVVNLRLDPNDPRRVLARVRLSGETPVKQDTQAKLALTGITGTSIIQLSGGTPQSPVLTGHDGEPPVIIAAPSPIARLLNNSDDLMTSINLLLHNANEVFSSDNVQSLGKTLEHLEQTTGVIAEQRGDIRQCHAATGVHRQTGQRHAGTDHGVDAQRQWFAQRPGQTGVRQRRPGHAIPGPQHRDPRQTAERQPRLVE